MPSRAAAASDAAAGHMQLDRWLRFALLDQVGFTALAQTLTRDIICIYFAANAAFRSTFSPGMVLSERGASSRPTVSGWLSHSCSSLVSYRPSLFSTPGYRVVYPSFRNVYCSLCVWKGSEASLSHRFLHIIRASATDAAQVASCH